LTPRRAWTVDLDGLDGILRADTPVAAAPAPPRELFLLPPAPPLVEAALPALDADADPFNESPTAVGVPMPAAEAFNESPTSIEIAAAATAASTAAALTVAAAVAPPAAPTPAPPPVEFRAPEAVAPPPARPLAIPPIVAAPPADDTPTPASGAGWVLPVAGLAVAAVVLGALTVGAWWAFGRGEAETAPGAQIAVAEAPNTAPAPTPAAAPAPAAPEAVAPPPAEAAPPEAVAPPAEAAAKPDTSGRSWTVHFERDGVDPVETTVPAWVRSCPRLGIVGHTDAAGDAHVNEIIGLGRAIATRRLVGDDAARAGDSVRSAGADEPAGDNSTVAGRRANRRAVVTCFTP